MPRTRFPRLGLWTLAALALVVGVGGVSLISSQFLTSAGDSAGSVRPSAQPAEAREVDASALVDVSTPSARALPEVPSAGTYRHRVVDEEGEPVAGATAWIEGESMLRLGDERGELRFASVRGIGFVVADGYAPGRFMVSSQPRDIRLARDAELELTVLWEDGTPVAGATIEARFPPSEEAAARRLGLARSIEPTDDQGRTLVSPRRIGRVAPQLGIEPPGGPRTWLWLPEAPSEPKQHATFVARLSRGSAGHRVHVSDTAGQPLADRAVTLRCGFEERARTDAEGWASFDARQFDSGSEQEPRATYVVELEPDRSWWYAEDFEPPRAGGETALVVARVDVRGRVLTPAPGSYLVASIGCTVEGNSTRFWTLPNSDYDVRWYPVGPDGSFESLPGWQGAVTFVAVRHRDHDRVLRFARVPADGGPVELEVPDVCRVTIAMDRRPPTGGYVTLHNGSRGEDPDGPRRAVFTESFGPSLRLELLGLRSTLEVPCGIYSPAVELPGANWLEDELDATGPTATLRLAIPELVRVEGTLTSSLRGPMAGLELRLSSLGSDAKGFVLTDHEGRFAVDFPAHGPIHLEPTWGDERIHMRLRGSLALEPPVDPAQPVVRYEIEEALLRVVERPRSPLLHARSTWIQRTAEAGERAPGRVSLHIGKLGQKEYIVAPGTYTITRRLDGHHVQSVQVTLEANEQVEAVLDSSQFAVVAVTVTVGDPEQRELRLRVHDLAGSLAAWDAVRRMDENTHAFREIVEPGTYAVEVESRLKGSRASEAPLDVWRGEITAVPGAQVPLRIHLR